MELNRVEALLEKYLEGQISMNDKNELKNYFLSDGVASHLTQYVSMFKHLHFEDEGRLTNKINPIKESKNHKVPKRNFYLISITASAVVLLGIGFYLFYASETLVNDNDLGTYNDPKVALEETQKALSLLSSKVNVGIESVQYLEEYKITKNRIFKNIEKNSN